MKLIDIQLENFRNYGNISAEFDSGVNLLVGCESGKFFFFEHKDVTTVSIDEVKSK